MQMTDLFFDFSQKKVLVVGGSRGIGAEVCNQFMKSGSKVFCASRTPCKIKNVVNYQCDISKEQDIYKLFKEIDDIDFCINVAGTNLCKTIDYVDPNEWDRVINTNLKSFYLICKYAVEIMKKNGGGRIVNVSSIAGRNKSLVSGVHYTSSKYGVIGFTKQLAKEMAEFNILVNCLCPSQTRTEMLQSSMSEDELEKLESLIPMKRISTTKEQAIPILFLCSEGASYITGSCIDVNGGQL